MRYLKKTLLLFFIIISSNNINANPDTVKIGAYIMSVHDINFHDNEYTMRMWLWFLHKNPNFDFDTQTEVPNAKSIDQPNLQNYNYPNGLKWQIMKMKCVMKQPWQVHDYPFDKQHLIVKFENTVYDKNSLVFKADTIGSQCHPDLTVEGWMLEKFNVYTGTTHYKTAFGDPEILKPESEYSNFNIEMILKRDAWGLFLKLFVGMYIAFMISCISFLINLDNVEPRFGLPVGGLFAAVGNKYIIDSLLPETSEMTLVDTLHSFTFLYIFLIISFSAITLILYNRDKVQLAKKVNKFSFIGLISSYLIINLVMVLRACL
jgi:hypothetical protein